MTGLRRAGSGTDRRAAAFLIRRRANRVVSVRKARSWRRAKRQELALPNAG